MDGPLLKSLQGTKIHKNSYKMDLSQTKHIIPEGYWSCSNVQSYSVLKYLYIWNPVNMSQETESSVSLMFNRSMPLLVPKICVLDILIHNEHNETQFKNKVWKSSIDLHFKIYPTVIVSSKYLHTEMCLVFFLTTICIRNSDWARLPSMCVSIYSCLSQFTVLILV